MNIFKRKDKDVLYIIKYIIIFIPIIVGNYCRKLKIYRNRLKLFRKILDIKNIVQNRSINILCYKQIKKIENSTKLFMLI